MVLIVVGKVTSPVLGRDGIIVFGVKSEVNERRRCGSVLRRWGVSRDGAVLRDGRLWFVMGFGASSGGCAGEKDLSRGAAAVCPAPSSSTVSSRARKSSRFYAVRGGEEPPAATDFEVAGRVIRYDVAETDEPKWRLAVEIFLRQVVPRPRPSGGSRPRSDVRARMGLRPLQR